MAAKREESLPTQSAESHDGAMDVAEDAAQHPANAAPACTESFTEAPLPASEAPQIPAVAEANGPVTKTPPRRMLKIRPNGKFASPKARVQRSVTPTVELPTNAFPSHRQATSAPEKILQISANGKLDLPRVNAPVEVTKRKGRERNSRARTKAKPSCIAIMRYGPGNGTEASLGRLVEEILFGTDTRPDSKSNRPLQHPRSTHPFFTGELSRKKDQESQLASSKLPKTTDTLSSQPQQAMQTKNTSGPREPRVTSKPRGIAKGGNFDCGAGFPTFGSNHAKISRYPGAQYPLWPPYEIFHVRCSSSDFAGANLLSFNDHELGSGRKLKDAQIQILPQENILNRISILVRLYENDDKEIRRMTSRDTRQFRRPQRKVVTGRELQQAICSRVACSLPDEMANESVEDDLRSFQSSKPPIHKSLLHVYDRIPLSRTAFDRFQCETQEWAHKYSPKSAEDVLQQGQEAIVLRDWLKGLIISSVGGSVDKSRTRESSVMGRRGGGIKTRRRKKRRADELDGFVVSSDEEANEMDKKRDAKEFCPPNSQEIKSEMRTSTSGDGERTANAVVISGPHGCGKTAAVFAVAKELDFEIFEVNAGSRRSGKDILDKVGDMARNHLVKHRQEGEGAFPNDQSLEMRQGDENLQADLDSGRQGTMQSFFQIKSPSKTKGPRAKDKSTKPELKKRDPKKNALHEEIPKPRDQRQSLILLEEVDVLFEEDKLFWATVLDLMLRSKRPVIMTCSDESLLPLDDMALYAILRFTPPPAGLATDYLLLVAASEGHLLSREPVQLLYDAKDSDLRASLAELNFHCQMGVGDSKGGLEWMLIDKPDQRSQPHHGEYLRVVSEGTYSSGMGWLSGEDISSQTCETPNELTELFAEVWNGWHIDIGAIDELVHTDTTQTHANSREQLWRSLQRLDRSCEVFSNADILSAPAVRWETSASIDTTQPNLTDKTLCNYIEGFKVLQADPAIDYTGMIDSLALALRASTVATSHAAEGSPINAQKVINLIPQGLRQSQTPPATTLLKLWSAFLPIANDSLAVSAAPKGMSNSSFDGPVSVILQDIAPYVRGIVSYDLRLEEQRRQLSALLAQPGAENKKTRTTRASRAALEGGSKANTRRERWFPKQTDFNSVLETGGKEWQKTALQVILDHSGDRNADSYGSRRSSCASGAGEDI